MTAKPADTKTRILDAAEKLFGQNGFDATSLRDITAEAEVNLAAVNYHFQSKDSLIDAVIARRVEPVNRQRLEMLEAAGPDPALEQILIAFMMPVMRADLFEVYRPLMARVLATPDAFLTRIFKKHLTVILDRFSEAFAKALPHLSRSEIAWRIHFTGGAMAHVLSRACAVPELIPEGKFDSQKVLAQLVTFAAAGFRAKEGF